jgi:AraC-like DNA-binding protein
MDGFRLSFLDLAPVALLAASGLLAYAMRGQNVPWVGAASSAHKVVAVVLYVHAVWCAWTGFRADLIEARRRFRLLFICAASAVGVAIAFAEAALRGQMVPAELELLKVVVIAVLAVALLAWSFELRIDWLAGRESAPLDEMPAGERQLLDALLDAMDRGRAYREPGLTIAALAARLKAPETLLRRLINRRLGHRNFNVFLNEKRIQEATLVLSDPARARLPVLSIALDSGFASIGPFNRAFKEALGVTPTEFRRQKLSGAESDP